MSGDSITLLEGGLPVASIIKKKKKGRNYYYAVQSKRVDGEPRIVWQKYLGTLDRILERVDASEPPGPKETVLFEAGGVAALLQMVNRLNLVELIDEIVPKRDQGPSVGQYMVLAALNRALAPRSKSRIGDWYESTILRRLWGMPETAFTSQRFWDHMDMIGEEEINLIQERLLDRIGAEIGLDTEVLLYDTTNFFTFIASTNVRSTLARRGRNKQKRNDLRQVGLSVIASQKFQVPLMHSVYEGNCNDLTLFPKVVKSLQQRYSRILQKNTDTTLICDKGCFGEEALETLAVGGVHFVCSLPSTYFSETFTISIDQLKPLAEPPGTRVASYPLELWSKECQLVLCYSENLYTTQLDSITRQMVKCQKSLADLQKSLHRRATEGGRGKRPTVGSVRAKVRKILSGQYLDEIIKTKVKVKKKGAIPTLQYEVDHDALQQINTHRLGRTLLVTDRLDWKPRRVVEAYHSLARIEDAFKDMKNTEFLQWQPAFHWTDQKLRVHGFYCVLALTLVRLVRKIAWENGIKLSVAALLEELSDIKEVAMVYPKHYKKGGDNRLTHSRMSRRQLKLAKALEIGQITAWG